MVSPATDPREYWRRMAKQIGLQEFGTEQDANMFVAQMQVESGDFNPDVVYGTKRGGSGEMGVAQYMPFNITARGVNPNDPESMLRDAAKWMKEKVQYFGDWEAALVNYNSGADANSLRQQYAENWKQYIPKSTRELYLPAINKRAASLGYTPGSLVPYQPREDDPLGGALTFTEQPSPYFPEYTSIRNQTIADFERSKIAYMQIPKAEEVMEESFRDQWFSSLRNLMARSMLVGGMLPLGSKKSQQETDDWRQQTRESAAQEDVVFTNMTRMQYRAELIDALPALVRTGRITNEQDVEGLLGSKVSAGFLNDDDVQWAKELYRRLQFMKLPAPAPDSPRTTVQELHAALEKPARPTPVGVHQLTDSALLQSLYQLYRPGRPYGLSDEDMAELYREAGLEDPDVKRLIEDLEPVVEDWEEKWQQSDELIQSYKSGIREYEVPKLSFWQWMKLVISQPALAALEALEPYNKYVNFPTSGAFHIELLSRVPSFLIPRPSIAIPMPVPINFSISVGGNISALKERFNKINKDSTTAEDRWLAYGKAWEEWDEAHWAYKLISETILDPLNTIDVGFSVLAGSSKVARLPVLGKFIGELNNARNAVADLPYTIGKAVHKTVPMTTRNRALAHTGEMTVDLFNATSTRVGRFAEGGFTAEELSTTIQSSVRAYLKDPLRTATTDAGRLGARLTSMRFIEPDEIARMGQYLGLPADYTPSHSTILTINKIFESTNPILVTERGKSLLQVPEASSLLLKSFPEVSPSLDNFAKATQLVNNKLAETSRVINIVTNTANPMEMVRMAQRYVYHTFVSNTDSMVAVVRADQKFFGSILDKVDYLTKYWWRDRIEKNFVTTMANWVLLYPTYGPMNVIETGGRSILDGVAPRVGFKVTNRFQRLWRGNKAIPYNLLTHRPRMEMSPLTPAEQILLDGSVQRTGHMPGLTKPIEAVSRATQRVSGGRVSVGSMSDWNRLSGNLTTEIQENFMSEKLLHYLRWDNPEEYRTIMQAIPETSHIRFSTLTKQEVDEIMQYVSEEALHGPEAVEGVKDMVVNLTNNKVVSDVAEVLSRDTVTQPSVKNAIINQARRGTLLDNIDDVVKRASVDQDIMNMQQLEYMRLKYDDMAKEIGELEIVDRDELLNLYSQLEDMTEAPERLVEVSRQSFEERVMDIIDETARRKLHDEDWNILSRFIDDSYTSVSDIITKLQNSARRLGAVTPAPEIPAPLASQIRGQSERRAAFDELVAKGAPDEEFRHEVQRASRVGPKRGQTWKSRLEQVLGIEDRRLAELVSELAPTPVPAGEIDNLISLGDKYRLRMEFWTRARHSEESLFRSRFAAKGKLDPLSNQAWWDETNALRREIWTEAKREITLLDDNIQELTSVISQVKLPPIRQFAVTGKLTVDDVAYIFSTNGDDVSRNLYRAETRSMLGRDNFARWVRRRATAVGKQAGKTADDLGFTREAISDVYDTLIRGMKLDPHIVNVLTPQREVLEGLRQQLHGIKNGMGVDPEDITKLQGLVDETVTNLRRTAQFSNTEGRATWKNIIDSAGEKARGDWEKAFTQYGPENIINSFFHSIHPFWSYEIQRWPWLWRTYVKHPGLFTASARYLDYTDRGYIHIPGTNLDFNPFRGTVFMGMFTGLFIRDYPEYEDYFPGLANVMDRLQRVGFYPGIHVLLPFTFLAAPGRPEWSRLFPQWVRTPLDALTFLMPESGVAKFIHEQILPDRFRSYLANVQLGKMGVQGSVIYGKILVGDKLEPDEQQLWDRAQSTASLYTALFEQTAMFRLNPPERRAFYEASNKALEEMTGVPVELIERTNRLTSVTGKRFQDIVPLDPLQQDIIQELEGYKAWMGTTLPLQPAGMQAHQAKVQQFWTEYETIRDKTRAGFYDEREGTLIHPGQDQLDSMLMKWHRGEAGGISPSQWVQMRGDLQAYSKAQFDALKNSDKFREVEVTLEERVTAMKEQRGIQPTFHPAQELLWLYYELQPELQLDEDTGNMVYDFDTYFAMVDWMIDAVPDGHRDRFLQMIQKDWTPLVHLRWEDSRNYLRPYRNTRIVELSQYDAEDRALIKRYSNASATERLVIRAATTDAGKKLLSKYETDITTARKNLRLISPQWNAVLSFWNPVVSLLTPESVVIYQQLMDERLGGQPTESAKAELSTGRE